jgi:hypothetical protein
LRGRRGAGVRAKLCSVRDKSNSGDPGGRWRVGVSAFLASFAVSAVALAAFVVVERHRAEPLLALRLFRSLPFTGASVIAVLAFMALGGLLFVITLHLQQVRGDSRCCTP